MILFGGIYTGLSDRKVKLVVNIQHERKSIEKWWVSNVLSLIAIAVANVVALGYVSWLRLSRQKSKVWNATTESSELTLQTLPFDSETGK
jgi:hypothetical protein